MMIRFTTRLTAHGLELRAVNNKLPPALHPTTSFPKGAKGPQGAKHLLNGPPTKSLYYSSDHGLWYSAPLSYTALVYIISDAMRNKKGPNFLFARELSLSPSQIAETANRLEKTAVRLPYRRPVIDDGRLMTVREWAALDIHDQQNLVRILKNGGAVRMRPDTRAYPVGPAVEMTAIEAEYMLDLGLLTGTAAQKTVKLLRNKPDRLIVIVDYRAVAKLRR